MKVGMLTGGGDCPGLNAVLRAVVRKGEMRLRRRARRVPRRLAGRARGRHRAARRRAHAGHAAAGRHDPRLVAHQPVQGRRRRRAGAAGARRARHRRPRRHRRRGHARRRQQAARRRASPVVGVPKTIDNDLSAPPSSPSASTPPCRSASTPSTGCTRRPSPTTACIVVEVMGRHAGHIALWAGIAGGATMVLIPEEPFDIEEVCAALRHRHENRKPLRVDRRRRRGRDAARRARSSLARPARSTPSATSASAASATPWPRRSRQRTGYETRAVVLGHVQRGGTPTAFDRVLSTRFGIAAIDAVHDGAFGQMVALRGGEIVRVPLAEATGELKLVDRRPLRRGQGLLRLTSRSDNRSRSRRRPSSSSAMATGSRR